MRGRGPTLGACPPPAAADLPYATPDFPGIGGTLRQRPEDFFVQELPLYEPSGEGAHVYFEAQKVGLTTREAIKRIARALDLAPRDVGYAGLKDKHAITRQLFSVPTQGTGIDEERVTRLEVEGVYPQWASLHNNKLKVGHLAGNRFAIKVRDVNPPDVIKLRPVLDRLGKTGLPNYYGEQRFGVDAQRPTHALGLALARRDFDGFLRLFLGGTDPRPDVAEARRLFDAGEREAALAAWPANLAPERATLETLVRSGGDAERAVRRIDPKTRQFYLSAAQSAVFNEVVADRVRDGTLAALLDGDVAVKHADDLRLGGMFTVEDAAAEQPRCERWEISPTGPMPGRKAKPAASTVAGRERQAAERLGVALDVFDTETGARRPLRVRPIDTTLAAGSDEHGGHITVAFTLPAGSFATVLLRELMKGPHANPQT